MCLLLGYCLNRELFLRDNDFSCYPMQMFIHEVTVNYFRFQVVFFSLSSIVKLFFFPLLTWPCFSKHCFICSRVFSCPVYIYYPLLLVDLSLFFISLVVPSFFTFSHAVLFLPLLLHFYLDPVIVFEWQADIERSRMNRFLTCELLFYLQTSSSLHQSPNGVPLDCRLTLIVCGNRK